MTDNEHTNTTVEETRTGWHVEVESKRGTGTRDQDKVRVEYWSEDEPAALMLERITEKVKRTMDDRRAHQPDAEGDDE